MEELISKYGYIALLIGTFLEGETVLIMAGFAAHRGYLNLPWVIVYAFLGTFFGDQFYYFIGYFKGISFLEKRPHWKSKVDKVFELIRRRNTLIIFGFRFMYGMRTITPFLLGTSGISTIRFFVLNMIGALIWAITFGILGYIFGHTVEIILNDIKRYESFLFLILLLIGSIIWFFHFRIKRRKQI